MFLSEHLLPEGFGHGVFIQCSGDFIKLTGGFAAVSPGERS